MAQARHCWVRDLSDWPGLWPGLLLEWQRGLDGAWRGRIIFVVHGPGEDVVVQAWVPAEHLAAAL